MTEEAVQNAAPFHFSREANTLTGGSGYDFLWFGTATSDGGFIAVGYTTSSNGDITGFKGNTDALIVKYNASGLRLWVALVGGSGQDYATSILPLADGSFMGVGYTSSQDGDISGNHGGRDAMIFKLSSSGAMQWAKTIGTMNNEAARSLVANPDGSFTLAGYRADVYDNVTTFDVWLGKVDKDGNELWQKTFGGTAADNLYAMTSSGDGGYVCAAYSSSRDGDVTSNRGMADFWILKVDASGNKVWQKSYGGSGTDWPQAIVKGTNGFLVVGKTDSNGGDVTGQHGQTDAWVLKLDAAGNKLWQKTFGGSTNDNAQAVVRSADGGYLIGINASGVDGSFNTTLGYTDGWIVKMDEQGNDLGHQVVGGSGTDIIYGLAAGSAGTYALFGNTNSKDGDGTGSHGDFFGDAWMLKFKDQ